MTENKEKTTFILTGGTIDGKYHPPSERKITKKNSVVADYIEKIINPHFSANFKQLIMIDSLEMTDVHRQKILDEINKIKTDKIIITHGSSTMVETAQYLEEKIPDNSKTIILVGAMVPLEGFYPTDAPFNLGYAIAQAQTRAAGVYICMNAHCFTPQEAVKNVETARFEFKDDRE